ncbi:MAG: hydrogenase formation protein HypD [Burkholderiales bacterium]
MQYIHEFRNPVLAQKLITAIQRAVKPKVSYRLMEFCGGHTHAVHCFALQQLLPATIELIHGPVCPVCVLPTERVDYAIYLAAQPEVIFCSYADMLRVPGSQQDSLLRAKARGADIRMVYSVEEALTIARENCHKLVIFFAIGFETTTPPTAVAILTAKQHQLTNFKVFCNHVLTPAAMQAILASQEPAQLDGFIGPSHVSVIIGSQAYQTIADNYKKPIVIAGFEPLDILSSILMLVEMINQQEYGIKNQYIRAVTARGNLLAQSLVGQVLEQRESFAWRGLGEIACSGVKIRNQYSQFDCELSYPKPDFQTKEHKGCACPDILRGRKKPLQCKLFGRVCTPANPLGPCMVSSEGACAAHYQYSWDKLECGSN